MFIGRGNSVRSKKAGVPEWIRSPEEASKTHRALLGYDVIYEWFEN